MPNIDIYRSTEYSKGSRSLPKDMYDASLSSYRDTALLHASRYFCINF